MKKKLALFAVLLASCLSSFATHYKAGEITYRVLGYLQFEATVTTYTEFIGPPSTLADRDTVDIEWGDGISSKEIRTNGPRGGPNGIPQGELIYSGARTVIKKSVYIGTHTYAGPLPHYVISVIDPNRVDNIININNGNSVNIAFFIEDTLRIFDPVFIGVNNSPILLNDPIDFANINDTFYHNPNAYDPDGDSLSYQLVFPFQGHSFFVPNYEYPEQVNISPDDGFTINAKTGEIIWATPKEEGIYTVAILITEFRNKINMGTVLRDMQIIVDPQNNDPPQIAEIRDTCIIAGSLLSFPVSAFDPNSIQSVKLTALGGPFEVTSSPAIFPINPPPSGNPVSATFQWQTNCTHIRKQFYQVVFKAVDSYVIPLADLETWIINVVAPPPENLTATAIGNQVNLVWNSPYLCDTVGSFLGFSVWRRESSNPFIPGTCDIGLAGRGYTKLVDKLTVTSYVDVNVTRGTQYCYRVLAEFAELTPFGLLYNKVESIPSNEACSILKRDVPVIKNVSVVTTDAVNGKIYVEWFSPVANSVDQLDTSVFRPPYFYTLLRSLGKTGDNLSPIYTSPSSATFAAFSDTTYLDTLLNTLTDSFSYRVDFYANGGLLVGSSDVASSIFVTAVSRSNRLDLDWSEIVPWTNLSYQIYRLNGSSFDSIGTSNVQSYSDWGLINDSLYCYKILSIGKYTDSTLASHILYNYSQETCERPTDKTAPCPPVLTVSNDCDDINNSFCLLGNDATFEFENRLTWTNTFTEECMNDIAYYNVYFSVSSSMENAVMLADTSEVLYSTLSAGCYAITAVDSAGNESAFSNIVCEDYCPCYQLPNVFTPNGDLDNDYFTPFMDKSGRFLFRFVDHIDIKIFNRWGDMVFKTSDPEIRWNGNDMKSNKPLKEGVYYYTCTVFSSSYEGVKKNNDILSGYIHLIRGNGGAID